MAAPIVEVIEHLVAGIVAHPDEVDVRAKQTRRGDLFEVRVNAEDLGKVIGRQGRTASAIRTVTAAVAGDAARIDFVDVDRRR
ncbi:RNA-binding protein [Aeromicrobium sp. Leaf350]|uniref:RNA-binding protein n=1 Tax=Aeromicrobium sp. Leaf350 TaxID=2876565 RepID=UPI001E5ED3C2|nr:RNA-binding protein [Aeromicrobium sp. Leaf350]